MQVIAKNYTSRLAAREFGLLFDVWNRLIGGLTGGLQ